MYKKYELPRAKMNMTVDVVNMHSLELTIK